VEGDKQVIFVGDDWAEDHHDIELMDDAGRTLARRRLPEGVAGVGMLHGLIATHAEDPSQVVVAIETDRGLWVAALVAAGYQVYAINPLAVARYRDRHAVSGAKSDAGDAHVLADLARTDRHQHRPIAGDSAEVLGVRVLARAHQRLIWDRTRQTNRLRSALREFFPAALVAFEDLDHPDALAVLARAPTPAAAARLSVSGITAALRKAGRQRNLQTRAEAIQTVLRGERLDFPEALANAYGAQVRAAVAVIGEMNRQIERLEAELGSGFEAHPDAEIIRSQPGLGPVLGARVLGEFGDDPNRYQDARSRKNYAGTSPLTKASGKKRVVVARFVRNRHLGDACYQWAFCALSASPGARAFYDEHRAKDETHDQALRVLSNRLVGILDACLRSRSVYDEHKAWGHRSTTRTDTEAA
jgi:transposase